MKSAITAADVDVLLTLRQRAQSEYDTSCRELVDDPDDRNRQAFVFSNAKRLRNAREQYAVALKEIGGQVRPGVRVPGDLVDLAMAFAEGAV